MIGAVSCVLKTDSASEVRVVGGRWEGVSLLQVFLACRESASLPWKAQRLYKWTVPWRPLTYFM